NRNSSSHPDGDWWGQRVLLTATIGGLAAKGWLTFANPMPESIPRALLTATIGGEEVRHWVTFYDPYA
ncbi:MAG: hypothetical protein II863_09595, partial [Kiritimatiellae bacterium]|nr:hypothetical protein [Kiritimatiellia bacterium]